MLLKLCVVAIGTGKGLFLAESDEYREKWVLRGPYFLGSRVYSVAVDTRSDPKILASVHTWSSTFIAVGDVRGEKWTTSHLSSLPIKRVWKIEPSPRDEPNTLYIGVEDAALYKSTNYGASWKSLNGLNRHPTRRNWVAGAGGLCLHSIILAGENAYVGISAAGVFESNDGGETWHPYNEGTRADFMRNKYPEVGQCVHRLVIGCDGKTLFQQNHCGVYVRKIGWSRWRDISRGLPTRFGFTALSHPRLPNRFYTVPIESDTIHIPPAGRLAVYSTKDAGKTWTRMSSGLPREKFYGNILRDAFTHDGHNPLGLYFGTTNGKVYYSADEGRSFKIMADDLPPVLSIHAALL